MKTEYRLFKNRTFIADRYLQFKSTRKKRNFPDFWNTHTVEVWRYIPELLYYIFDYISEEKCVYEFENSFQESRHLHFFEGQENPELTDFVKKYVDINDYFKFLNLKRDEYIDKEEKTKNSPDIIPLT